MTAGDDLPRVVAEARAAGAAGDLLAVIDIVAEAVETEDLQTVRAVLAALRPADRVDVFEQLDRHQQSRVIVEISDEQAAAILEELEEEDAAEVASGLPAAELAPILDQMDPDEAADLLSDLTHEQAESALRAMDDVAEADARSLMVHGDDTAGGRMTSDFVALYATETVAESLVRLRRHAPGAESIYYLYVIDDAGALQGVINLRQIVVAEPATRVGALMDRDVIRVRVNDDQETAARLLARYGLLALPVVDARDRLIGVITHDDLVVVLQEEATEDMYRMVGLDEAARTIDPVGTSIRRRLPWLLLNLVTYLVPVATIRFFQPTLQAAPTLAALFPVVTGQGGNVGMQTITFVVRSLALGEVATGSELRLLGKEVATGLVNGLVTGLVAGAVAWAVAGGADPALRIAAAMMLAMMLNLAAGGLVGTVVPLTLRRVGLDPAAASSVFVTTATDTLGVLFFLGLATVFLGRA